MSENNPLITISYEGGMQFVAENSTGCKTLVEPAVSMGGSGKTPNPVDYMIMSLGSCMGIIMIMDISKKGFKLDSFTMNIYGIKSDLCSCFYEKLHLVINLSGDIDDHTVAELIQNTMMNTCPIATIFRKGIEITWEHHIKSEILRHGIQEQSQVKCN